VRKDEKAQCASLADLKGKRLGVGQGSDSLMMACLLSISKLPVKAGARVGAVERMPAAARGTTFEPRPSISCSTGAPGAC
jgi:cystine transport system substrate-binding protein